MPVIETRLGDRLDLLAETYLQDSFRWEEIAALNLGLLTADLYLPPGLLIEIPELVAEKIPDLLPWNDPTESQDFDPEPVPPDPQPGANPSDILSGSGWLTPLQIKALLEIPNYTFPISIEQGGHGATTATGARAALGAVGFADIPASIPPSAIGSTIAPLVAGLVPVVNLPAYPTLGSLGGVSAAALNAAVGSTIAPLVAGLVPLGNLPAYPTLASLSGVSTATYTAGLALKIDAAQRSAANGVAPLGADSLVPSSFLPAYPTLASLGALASSAVGTTIAPLTGGYVPIANISPAVQFQLLIRSSTGGAIDLNSSTFFHSALQWVDNNVSNTNLPSTGTTGILTEHDALYGTASANLYRIQSFYSFNNRIVDRQQNAGTWGAWYERAHLNKAQTFTSLQDFAASATFKGGSIPPVTTTMVQAGVDVGGQPRVWLINAAATTGNRLKSMTVASNGNIIFTHHADDGTEGLKVQLTTSGNLLTDGTVRPGSGSTTFTGASFVPGSTYFRTDLLGDSGAGCLTYSDGTIWRRVGDGTPITESARLKKTLTGTTAATQGGTVNIAHGLTGTKITSISGVIFYATGQVVPINGRQSNYANYCATDATNFSLTNEAANSVGILSKNFSVIIEYTA